jgi:DNA-directed RNA polymerase specialized sigma24 family protein
MDIASWLCLDSTAKLIMAFAAKMMRNLRASVDGIHSWDAEDIAQDILVSILEAGHTQVAPTTDEESVSLVRLHARPIERRLSSLIRNAPQIGLGDQQVVAETVAAPSEEDAIDHEALAAHRGAQRSRLRILLTQVTPIQRDAIERLYLSPGLAPSGESRETIRDRKRHAIRRMVKLASKPSSH